MTAITSLPELRIRADGEQLSDGERRPLAALRVRQRLSLPTQAELTFVDPPPEFDVDSRLGPGTQFQIKVGRTGAVLFEGDTTAVEHIYETNRGVTIRVRGYDRLHRLRKRQQVRTFADVSAAELAGELAGAAGLGVETSEDGPSWPQITQHAQTDLELLQEITAQAGLFFTAADGAVRLFTLEGGHGEEVDLAVGDNLWRARTEVNAEQTADRVAAAGWDPRRFEVHRGEAGTPRTTRDVAAGVTADQVGGDGERALVDVDAPTAEINRSQAQGELDRRTATEVTLEGVAEGDPRIRPGVPVRVTETARGFAGRYVVASATHTVDDSGFLTEFSTQAPPDRRPRRPPALPPGRVVDVDDPDGLGRVRVELPTFEDAPAAWLQVLLPAAGPDKGLVALPDVGDHVLVALPHGDPGRGVVLGCVYGSEQPPDAGVADGRVRRYTVTTPGGQKMILDDTGGRLRVENDGGSFVDLQPDEVRLHAAGDLVIEAPGQQVRIVGQAVDFQRG